MVSRSALRPLLRSAQVQYRSQPQRYFSSSIRKAGSPAQPTNHERTTHFGFETVSEAEKEARGIFLQSNSMSILTPSSRWRIQQRSSLLRHNERLHVPRNPPPLERPLRTFHQSRLLLQYYLRGLENARHRRRNRRYRIPTSRSLHKYQQLPSIHYHDL